MATGWKLWTKRAIVNDFHSALVAGSPQKRYFTTLGMQADKIFLGYDAIDNEYFYAQSEIALANSCRLRKELALPDRYFLNLGRFAPKKDLATLVRAFAEFRKREIAPIELVLVGAGSEESQLKSLAKSLKLTVREDGSAQSKQLASIGVIHFRRFCQVTESPIFYSLAEAFVLPSVSEEWGLVVNEAMACGLPVIVSSAAGCAEDLVVAGVNGYTFPPGDAYQLADCLESLAQNPLLRDRMSVESKGRIASWGCDNFAINAIRALETAGLQV